MFELMPLFIYIVGLLSGVFLTVGVQHITAPHKPTPTHRPPSSHKSKRKKRWWS